MLESRYTSYHSLVQKYNRVAKVFSGSSGTAVYPEITADLLWADQSFFLCGQDTPTRPNYCSIPQMFWRQYILDDAFASGWQPWQFLLCQNPLDMNEFGTYTVADLEAFLSGYFGFQLTKNQFIKNWCANTLLRPMPQVITLCNRMLDLFRWRVRLARPQYTTPVFTRVNRSGEKKETVPDAIASCLAATPRSDTDLVASWTLGRRAGYTVQVHWGVSPCVFNDVDPWDGNAYLASLNPTVRIFWDETESSTNGGTGPATMHPKNVADLASYDLMQGTSYTDAIACIPTGATSSTSYSWHFHGQLTAIDCLNII